jgi:hypothetical protein
MDMRAPFLASGRGIGYLQLLSVAFVASEINEQRFKIIIIMSITWVKRLLLVVVITE